MAYAKEKTLESYRNGIKAGAEAKGSRRTVAPADETQNAGT